MALLVGALLQLGDTVDEHLHILRHGLNALIVELGRGRLFVITLTVLTGLRDEASVFVLDGSGLSTFLPEILHRDQVVDIVEEQLVEDALGLELVHLVLDPVARGDTMVSVARAFLFVRGVLRIVGVGRDVFVVGIVVVAEQLVVEELRPDDAVDGLRRSVADGAHGVGALLLRLLDAVVALCAAFEDECRLAVVAGGAAVDERLRAEQAHAVHMLARLHVVERVDDEIVLLVE